MALRMKFRKEEVGRMTDDMVEKIWKKGRDEDGKDGDRDLLPETLRQNSRVKLLTLKDMPWSQQENEPLLWYERFSIYYLPLELGNRSMARAYGNYSGKRQPAAPPDWYDMRDKWRWEERAAAYDVERTKQRSEMLDDVDIAIEDEIKGALLIGLRAAVDKVNNLDVDDDDMDVKTAMSAIPKYARELQDIYGVGKKAGATKSLEEMLTALPKGLTQKVMIYIDKRQQGMLPGNVRGEVVEGESRKVDGNLLLHYGDEEEDGYDDEDNDND